MMVNNDKLKLLKFELEGNWSVIARRDLDLFLVSWYMISTPLRLTIVKNRVAVLSKLAKLITTFARKSAVDNIARAARRA